MPRSSDIEKTPALQPVLAVHEDGRATPTANANAIDNASAVQRRWRRLEDWLVGHQLETRGIQRVEAHQRHDLRMLGTLQIAIYWFSVNLAANNITLGMLGPAVFGLNFRDASLSAVFGMLVGCLPVAYTATFGPRSGNRTMIFARFTMGWYPAKLVVLLNIIVLLGYALIDCVVAGQILSAVAPNGSLSIVVGIIVVAILTWVITTFGYKIFHYYERYAWIPQLIVFCILTGVSARHFDLSAPGVEEGVDGRTLAGSRLSFFSLCLSAAITYAGGAGDYFVYFPESTPKWRIFWATMIGLSLSFTFSFILGAGLASGVTNQSAWQQAYQKSQGALIVAGFEPLGSFGRFCGVIMAFGLVANLIPPTYSSGVDFQILGRYLERVPRAFWNSFGVVIYTVCALAGREHLAEIFTNFLALMGYWVCIWIAITLEEHLIFRQRLVKEQGEESDRGFDWTAWNRRDKLPRGFAALVAFLIGWAGAILCMAQVWYTGPLAKLVGQYGADMGNYVGFAWAALVYPPLRWFELKRFGR